jgi:hypothetical protein
MTTTSEFAPRAAVITAVIAAVRWSTVSLGLFSTARMRS